MFEQSVLPRPHTRSTPAFFVVTATELLLLAASAVIPLFFTPPLIGPELPVVIRFVRAVTLVRPAPVKTVMHSSSITHPAIQARPFYAPPRIPQKIAAMPASTIPIEAAPAITGEFVTQGGIPGAVDNVGIAPPPPPSQSRPANRSPAPLHVTSSIQAAKLINKVIPIYPPLAKQTRQFGRVRLVATVGRDGHVKRVEVVSGPAFLAAAAIEAVKQWIYQPTLLNGKPVEVIAPIDVNFVLN
jgi:periplasmic protein TonB